MSASEDSHQKALFQWASIALSMWPEVALLYHIPNGGSRHPAEAAKLKSMGVKPGMPDLHLPCARLGFNSLYIELKRSADARLSSAQLERIALLERHGNRVIRCDGWEHARDEILRYLTPRK